MRTRDAILYRQKTLDDVGTLTVDLDQVDPVSAIHIEVGGTNGTTSNKGNFATDVVTKLEIVDGSEVLASVSGSELHALHFYKQGRFMSSYFSEWASGGNGFAALLMFGRKLWDRDFAIDFTRYRNPQLKLTTNIAAIRALSATTAFATGTLKATIIAKVMEEMPSKPSKFLSPKQVASWTSSTSGDRRIELPRDLVIRMLMGRYWVQGSDIDECITDLKLTADSDKFIPLNEKVVDLDTQAAAQFGYGMLKHDLFAGNDADIRGIFNKHPNWRLWSNVQSLFDIYGVAYAWSSNLKLWVGTHAGVADSTDRQIIGIEEGHAPHATLPIAFGDPSEPDTWFDQSGFGKLELIHTEAVAAACSLIAEQVHNMP